MVAIQYNKLLQPFAQRLQERGKPKLVILAAVMHNLLHIIDALYGQVKQCFRSATPLFPPPTSFLPSMRKIIAFLLPRKVTFDTSTNQEN